MDPITSHFFTHLPLIKGTFTFVLSVGKQTYNTVDTRFLQILEDIFFDDSSQMSTHKLADTHTKNSSQSKVSVSSIRTPRGFVVDNDGIPDGLNEDSYLKKMKVCACENIVFETDALCFEIFAIEKVKP